MTRPLDFFVIGAQKAGTTTLFRWLEGHPELHLPPEKEAPFFSLDDRWAKGYPWYLETFFAGAPEGARWGTVTPQYLLGHPDVPARIAATCPQARLVAILRDPVERARSHHRMMVRRGTEQRTFAQMVDEELDPARLQAARAAPDNDNAFVTQGEYGRLLSAYLEHVPRDQLFVGFSKDLDARPAWLFPQILAHLGVDDAYRPPDLGERYHQGGATQRLPWAERLAKGRAGRAIRRLLPGPVERRFRYWFKTWNTKAAPADQETVGNEDAAAEARLRAHYAADRQVLEAIVGPVPWPTG